MRTGSELGRALPRWSLARWLVEPGGDIPVHMRRTLLASLYSSLPIFAGGVLNTIAVSAVVATRMQSVEAYVWVVLELVLAALRLPALVAGRRAIAEGRRGPIDFYVGLAVLWAASVGYGTFICVASGDWVAATLACLSAAAMVGGICFRNFGAPRLVAVMIALSLGPCAVAAVLSGETILKLVALQIPFYLFSMSAAAFHLNRLLLRTMRAEMINDHSARHDPLTGALNRTGLSRWAEDRAEQDQPLALFYIDLDGFKAVNDTLGHSAGDAVLAGVAERLRNLTGAEGVVARLGGDEFVIIRDGMTIDAAPAFGRRILAAIAGHPYSVDGHTTHIGASVGVAVSPDHDRDLTVLLGSADTALYAAKAAGRSTVVTAAAASTPPAPAPKKAGSGTSRRRTGSAPATAPIAA